jgi:septum site-determining protein MinD
MSRIITIASGKGGTGKTTLTANLGICLSRLGKKVLLIDADVAMANLSLILGMQSSPITLHDVLLGEAQVHDSIYDGPEGMHFIPSGLSLDNYKRVDSERLSSIVNELSDNYDFILLDAAAGIEKNVLSAFSASQETLLVTIPTSPAIADALKTKLVAQRLGSKVIGVIMNFVMGEKGEINRQEASSILELPIYGLIPYDPEVRKSFMQQKVAPVSIRKPNSQAAQEFQKIASRLTGTKVQENQEKKTGFFSKLFSKFRKRGGLNVSRKTI